MNEINETGMARVSEAQHVQQLRITPEAQEIQRLGMYLDNVLGADGGVKQTGINMDAVMSGCLNGYLGVGDCALGIESPLASSEVLNMTVQSAQTSWTPQAIQPSVAMGDIKSLETLGGFRGSEVSEVALGLIPGLGMDVAVAEKSNPVAVSEILDKSPAHDAGINLQQKMSIVNYETLSNWEMDISSEVARLENLGNNTVVLKDVDKSALAQNVKSGEQFDVRLMTGLPVIEGDRKSYNISWNQIHDTIEGYDKAGSISFVGVADWIGEPIHNNFSLGYNETASQTTMSLENSIPVNQIMGYHSVVNNELLGFLDLSSYSQAMAMGVNPSDSVAMLKPGKYVSNLVNGYYT